MIPALLLLRALGIADIDWEAVLSVALGLGACAVAWVEHRRTSKLDAVADDLRERVATLEAVAAHRDDVVELVHAVEQLRSADKATDVGERLAALTAAWVGHAERLSTLEARADHQPWKHTRRKDNGRFAKPQDVAEPEAT